MIFFFFYVSFMIFFFTCLFCRQRLTGKKFTVTQPVPLTKWAFQRFCKKKTKSVCAQANSPK